MGFVTDKLRMRDRVRYHFLNRRLAAVNMVNSQGDTADQSVPLIVASSDSIGYSFYIYTPCPLEVHA